MPETLHEESWDKVLNTTYSIPDPRTRMYEMVEMLEILPSYLKSKTWLDAWEIATGSNDKNLLLTVIGGFKYVYFYLSSELREIISNLEWMTDWWSDAIVHKVIEGAPQFWMRQVEGLGLFLQFASTAFKIKIWNKMPASQSTDLDLYLFATLFPVSPESDRSDVLKKIVYRSIGNKVDDSLQVIFSRWSAEDVWQVWQYMYVSITERFLTASEWASFLTPFLSNTHCVEAWEKHILNLSLHGRFGGNFYDDIAVQLAKKLPVEYLPQAWQDVEQNAYDKRKIKSAMAPRLPEEFIEGLAKQEISLPQLPGQDIFTCSITDYIRYGGPWLTTD